MDEGGIDRDPSKDVSSPFTSTITASDGRDAESLPVTATTIWLGHPCGEKDTVMSICIDI